VRRSCRVVFEDLVKDVGARLPEPARDDLTREVGRVQEWLTSEPHGKAVALFSCQARGLWQVHLLAVHAEDHLAFELMPDLAPLLRLLDEHERYAVALVDKEKARLFSVFLGEIEESGAFRDFVPHKTDQGGVSQAGYQRHHEIHVLWHLKRVAGHLAELLRRRRFDRLILAGPEEVTSALRRVLPRVLAGRLAAVIPADTFASDADILAKTLEVERQVEREAEERLFAELLELAGPGGRATLGVRSYVRRAVG
jgi:peptide chain release factor subunit 1